MKIEISEDLSLLIAEYIDICSYNSKQKFDSSADKAFRIEVLQNLISVKVSAKFEREQLRERISNESIKKI